MQMIRPFHLRDVPLVHRLSEQGVSLHTESALIKNLNPVRGALFGLISGDYPTYIWKADNKEMAGFIQLFLEEDSQHGHILYLSSTAGRKTPHSQKNGYQLNNQEDAAKQVFASEEAAWLPLLDQAVIESGRRGIHSLVAEVGESGYELPLLRRAGFAVYTRQDIWVLEQEKNAPRNHILSPRRSADDWEIQLLYANTVPRLVQLVEPMPPLNDGHGWVLREDDEITAFVHIHNGAAATWMRLFIHPNAEAQIDDIVYSALQVRQPTATHPVYCCVRRYQSWIQNALRRVGFSLWGSQAVMVKHTVHHLPKPVPDLAASLEAQGVTPTAPIVQRYYPSQVNGKAGPHGV